ncbi:MAG TPA: hypothetical protein VI386_14900 [Candidatus Sulfotelmatobacter sp.]
MVSAPASALDFGIRSAIAAVGDDSTTRIYGTDSKKQMGGGNDRRKSSTIERGLEHACVKRVGGTVKREFQERPEQASEIQVKSALERTSGRKKSS